ncbi:MAG TPA: protein kinase [Thermoanaerobaculia bacterium]|nr:protein kinase [Thermoanaerobaculia bacterium]
MSAKWARGRRLGDYLLVARLGEDALGTVYRALHSSNGQLVRLRVLRSPELSLPCVLAAIQRNAERKTPSFYPATVLRSQFDVADGTPYLAWHDAGGWTLDSILAKARAVNLRVPVEYALQITERAAAALEHAWWTVVKAEPTLHGALWPGFVSISNAEVGVGGFGLAEAVLPSLRKRRMSRDIAPYVAPEARRRASIASNSDVYSLGVLLVELLTGHRPSLDASLPRFRVDNPFSQDLCLLLRFALAHHSERFASVVEMRRAIQKLIVACPSEASTAGLALFLYELLNSEGQSLLGPADLNSTNPIVFEPEPARTWAGEATPSFRAETPNRSGSDPRPQVEPESPATMAPVPIEPALLPAPAVFANRTRAGLSPRMRQTLGIAAALAAIGTIVGLDFSVMRVRSDSHSLAPPTATRHAHAGTRSGQTHALGDATAEAAAPTVSTVRVSGSAPRSSLANTTAEALRLHAALLRIAAERLDAVNIAGEAFREGRINEERGERLLRARKYAACQEAFRRAAQLFLKAESLSHEERARQIQLLGGPLTSDL